MEQTMIVTSPALSSMTVMMPPTMFAKDPSPTLNALKTLRASGTPAMWATAVWGTKPATDHNSALELPSLRDSSGCSEWTSPLNAATANFLNEAVKIGRYGAN